MNLKLFRFAFTAAIGGLLFGFDTAVVSGTTESIEAFFGMTKPMLGFAISSALIGCVVGALGVGKPGDIYGRRKMLFVSAVLFFVSAIWTGAAQTYTGFVIARIIGGLGVGAASVMAPMYIAEISPARLRGRLVSTAQLAIVTGIVTAFFSNYALVGLSENAAQYMKWAEGLTYGSNFFQNVITELNTNAWRYMYWAECVPAGLYFILLFLTSPSPRWLVKVGRVDQARDVIRLVDAEENAETVLADIQESLSHEERSRGVSLFHQPYLGLVIIGMVVGMFNQFTGINIIMYYAPMIFKSAGFAEESALLQTVAIGGTNLIFTFLGMALIDKLGRKTLLMVGALAMPVCLGLFAYGYMNEIKGPYLLVCMLAYVVFFCTTQGIVIWVILSEMFPNQIRARACAISSFSLWVFNALSVFLFPVLKDKFGVGPIFIFYALATLCSFFFFWKFLIETKGKTLEDIEQSWTK
jgi:sugar porter (SP) family MFS transporter